MRARRIFFVSGARSEYDIQLPVAQALSADGMDVAWVLGASHLSPFHGWGAQAARSDVIRVAAEVPSLLSSETWEGRGLSFTILTDGLIRALRAERPDIVFVAGDREEALAGALASTFLQIPVAHIYGGDRCVASELDEVLRPAISKLSHLHFTASEAHRERLIRMGELPERVWTTGGPNLDLLANERDLPDELLSHRFGFDVRSGFLMCIYHPSPMMPTKQSFAAVTDVLQGLATAGLPILASYPNTDPGNISYRDALESFAAVNPLLQLHHNLPRDEFVSMYRRCSAIVGNSSSIVTESTFLHVPGLLIGPRQDLRTIGDNVLRVKASFGAVQRGLAHVLYDPEFALLVAHAPSIYGDGNAAKRISKIIASLNFGPELLQKMMPY